ncbi:Uncharacterised protein [Salmonella enterica subsp. enterica serovar Typhi]|nr:Uncharacterised protein [Salmonella enterica subsp. enterica serovar Typhi]
MIYLYPLTSLNLPNRLLIRLISLLHQILQHSQLHTDWGERGVVCGILLQTAVPSYLKCHPFWCTAYYWVLSYSSG